MGRWWKRKKPRKDGLSHGELRVKKILDELNLAYEREKTFEGCKRILPLRFDFFVPSLNSCIEFDGSQHVEGWMGDEGSLALIKERDEIKNQYCLDNKIRLIRVKSRFRKKDLIKLLSAL